MLTFEIIRENGHQISGKLDELDVIVFSKMVNFRKKD